MMPKFDPLRFIADHAGLSLADAILEAYRQGQQDAQPEIVRCKDCKHYYFADNRIPQEQRYTCELDGDRWNPDSYCSYAERSEE